MDGDINTTLPEPPEKISAPTVRKPGRKPGQKTGDGKSDRMRRLREAKARKAARPMSDAESVEQFGKPADEKIAKEESAPEKRKRKAVSVSADKLVKSLKLAASGIASLAGEPQDTPAEDSFKLSDEEAKAMAETLHDFLEEFDITVSSKAAATTNLIGVWGPVSIRRVIYMRQLTARKAAKRAQNAKHGKHAQTQDAPFQASEKPAPAIDPIFDPGFLDMGGV